LNKMVAFYKQEGYNIFKCLNLGLWLKIDASRRRNDPRKPAKGR
jgi:hypothetical protein